MTMNSEKPQIDGTPSRDRTVHVSSDFRNAEDWDIQQHVSMSIAERLTAARVLKDRAYPSNSPDVRECSDKG